MVYRGYGEILRGIMKIFQNSLIFNMFRKFPAFNNFKLFKKKFEQSISPYVSSGLSTEINVIDPYKFCCAVALNSSSHIFIPYSYRKIKISMENFGVKYWTEVGPVIDGDEKFSDGILAPNGKIYCIPYNSTRIFEIDPSDYDKSTYVGPVFEGTKKWKGGVLGSDGNIYGIPFDSEKILKIDLSNIDDSVLVGPVFEGTEKWSGGALYNVEGSTHNGNIYCAPYSSNYVLEIIPSDISNSLTIGSEWIGTKKWSDCVKGINDWIYCSPYDAEQYLVIDPEDSNNNIVTGPVLTGTEKYSSLVAASDNLIYAIPFSATQILKISPTNSANSSLSGPVLTGTLKFVKGVQQSDGYIYCPGFNSNNLLKIYPPNIASSNKNTTLFNINTIGRLRGGCLANNSKIYALPSLSPIQNKIFEIDTTTPSSSNFVSSDLIEEQGWREMVLAPNGKLYGVPFNSEYILEFDPLTLTATLVGPKFTGVEKWTSGILAPNGKIYCSPSSHLNVLEIDPNHPENSRLIGEPNIGITKWGNCLLAPNGKIYCVPSRNHRFLEIDPYTSSVSLVGTLLYGAEGTIMFLSACLHTNKKIYCLQNTGKLYEFNPENLIESKFIDFSSTITTAVDMCLGLDGNIYIVEATKLYVFDPDDYTTSVVSITGTTASKLWSTLHVAPNGKIYGLPSRGFETTNLLEITFDSSMDKNVCLSPFLK